MVTGSDERISGVEYLTSHESTDFSFEKLSGVLKGTDCAVYKRAALLWRDGNSAVTSSPAVDLLRLFKAAGRVEVAVNFVSIQGACGEPLHYHTAHLIGVVVRGGGYLLTGKGENKQGEVDMTPVAVGDLVVIPRGAYHIFECKPSGGLDYVALEFSDAAIDYQKHWTED